MEGGRGDAPAPLLGGSRAEEPASTYMQVCVLALLPNLGAHTKKRRPYENPYVERTLGIRGTYQKSTPLPQNPYVERTFETFGAQK